MEMTEFALWIADTSRDEDRRSSLVDGRSLTELASREQRIPGGWDELARVFAEAWSDGWITFDYEGWPGDAEPPEKHAFRHHHLQRCRNIRIARDAWSAIPALRAELETAHEPSPGGGPERDIFICHAGEDKDEVARPLAEQLRSAGWKVWYDEFELKVGDGLREKIDEGLQISRFGAVILSPAFLRKKAWTERELDGLTTREVDAGNEKVILPIWHGVTREDVAAYSPVLANRRAANVEDGLNEVQKQLEDVLRGSANDTPATVPATAVLAPSRDVPQAPAGRALDWTAPRPEFDANVIAALRDQDEISLTLFIEGLPRQAVEILAGDDPETELSQFLDSSICFAATLLRLNQVEHLTATIRALFSVYSVGHDAHGLARQDLPISAAQLWLWILERLVGLGGLAVRRERWDALRPIVFQHGEGYEWGPYKTWLRHGLTMAAREGLFTREIDGQVAELSLLVLAAEQVDRLDCLRPDVVAGDDAIITSLCRFDFLAALVAIDEMGTADDGGFYPSFSSFYTSRVEPLIVDLVTTDVVRPAVFHGDDAQLASALLALHEQARFEARGRGGWTGYESREVTAFIADHAAATS
jgi:hypothetical protein